MDLKSKLLEIEHQLADGGGDDYELHLDERAVVIVPGQALDKRATVEAMRASAGWSELALEDVALLELSDDSAALTYRFDGRRGEDFSYSALMSSVYVRRPDAWRLVLHQQTPLG